MIKSRQHKILYIILFLTGLGAATGLILFALKQNINLFYTPTELFAAKLPVRSRVRLGGLVRNDSVKRNNLTVNFVITDEIKDVTVTYTGIVPDLFREGQGVVALGVLGADNIFYAEQILAKHDENYMPPELASLNHSNSINNEK